MHPDALHVSAPCASVPRTQVTPGAPSVWHFTFRMFSLTASLHITGSPDPPMPVRVYPVSWVVTVSPSEVHGIGILTWFSHDQTVAIRCDVQPLASYLLALHEPELDIDTALYREFYSYEFYFSRWNETGGMERTNKVICLNSCAHVGGETEALKSVLSWFGETLEAAAPESRAREHFALWCPPPPLVNEKDASPQRRRITGED